MMNSRGITLIELMMVVVLMMIVLGISGAAFTGMTRGTSERAAVSQVTSALSLARQYAITHKEPIDFQIGMDTNQNMARYMMLNDYGVVISESLLPAGQYFDLSGDTSVVFKSDGTLKSIGAATQNVSITNPATSDKVNIKITGLTGLVRVE